VGRLVLIKHSLPEVVPARPAATWRLGEEGRRRARLLADRLVERGVSPALLATSPEPKAAETATIVAAANGWPAPRVEPGLREHEGAVADWLAGEGAFEAAVARLFARPGERVFGEETADAARARFAAAVDAVLRAQPSGDVVVVAHGTVVSLFVAVRAVVEPFPLWRRLAMPSFVVLTRPGLEVADEVDEVDPGRYRTRHR